MLRPALATAAVLALLAAAAPPPPRRRSGSARTGSSTRSAARSSSRSPPTRGSRGASRSAPASARSGSAIRRASAPSSTDGSGSAGARVYAEGLVGPWIFFDDEDDRVRLHAAFGFGLLTRSLSFGLEVGWLDSTSMIGVRVAFPL